MITASLLAGVTMPFTAAYTVSKRALTAYADVLRLEYGTHLDVTTVYPGYVDTPIHDRSRAAGVSLDGLVPAEQVRDTVLTAVAAAAAARPPGTWPRPGPARAPGGWPGTRPACWTGRWRPGRPGWPATTSSPGPRWLLACVTGTRGSNSA